MRRITKIVSVSLILLVVFSFTGWKNSAMAAPSSGPNVWMSWEANSFVPAQYLGKALATTGSTITVFVQLVENNKLASAKNYNIKWLVNNKPFDEGRGLTSIDIVVEEGMSQYTVAALFHASGKKSLDSKVVVIPVVLPKLIIDSPYYGNVVNPKDIRLGALAYFFNIVSLDELSISWTVNDSLVAIKTNEINFDVNTGSRSDQIFPIVAKARSIGGLIDEVVSQKLFLGLTDE